MRARRAYDLSLKLFADQPWVHTRLAEIALDAGDDAAAGAHFEAAWRLEPGNVYARDSAVRLQPRTGSDRINFLAIGTIGRCNASCVHCPTGMEATRDTPKTVMPLPMFRDIIDGIVALDVPIYGHVAFGLFGDALVDPHVVERARYVRARLPHVRIAINTNGAAFTPARHAALRDVDPIIGLHCESLDADTFSYLMQPLKLARMMPKYEQILATFGGSVFVAVPLSRRNFAEYETIHAWFAARGGIPFAAPLASRCADDLSLFRSLALAPEPMRCSSQVLDDFIVDCDGTVLTCCQDFRRLDPIGDLRRETVADVFHGARRKARARTLDAGLHQESPTCSRCFADLLGTTVPA